MFRAKLVIFAQAGQADMAEVILRAQRLFGGGGTRKSFSPPAKTDAKTNVHIVDKGHEFPHSPADTIALP